MCCTATFRPLIAVLLPSAYQRRRRGQVPTVTMPSADALRVVRPQLPCLTTLSLHPRRVTVVGAVYGGILVMKDKVADFAAVAGILEEVANGPPHVVDGEVYYTLGLAEPADGLGDAVTVDVWKARLAALHVGSIRREKVVADTACVSGRFEEVTRLAAEVDPLLCPIFHGAFRL